MDESTRKWTAFQKWQRKRFQPSPIPPATELPVPAQTDGYQNITIGKIGSGRSYATKLQVLNETAIEAESTRESGPLFDTLALAQG